MFEELFPVLEVLEVDDAGDDAEVAVVNVDVSSGLEFPLGGEAAEAAATDDLNEVPGGEVSPVADLLAPEATRGVGLFLEVDVVRSWGDATLAEDVESAYLQLEVDGADGADAA